ncbi:hypothetical protein JCM5350_005580 [Sporobolomyces pararoseus]
MLSSDLDNTGSSEEVSTPTNLTSSQSLSESTSDSPSPLFSHLPKDAIPADFLDSALQAHPPEEAAIAFPSPASTLRPPPETEGNLPPSTSALFDKLDERISRTKERKGALPPLKLDTTTSTAMAKNPSSSSSLPTPTSPALPPRPSSSSSRPSSRPPSISRRTSEYRTRSPSSSISTTTNNAQDPKRLSVSSATSAGLTSPRIGSNHDGGSMPPSPLGPSRRTSSQNVNSTSPRLNSSSNPSTSTPAHASTEEVAEERSAMEPWEVPVTVRDWAYPESDPRHLGLPHPDLISKDDEEGGGGDARGRFRRNRSSRNRFLKGGETEDWSNFVDQESNEGLGLGSPIDQSSRSTVGGSSGGGISPSSGNGGGGSSFSWGFVTSHSTDFPNSSPASSSIDGDEPRGYAFNDADDFAGSGGDGFYSNGDRDESEIEQELGLGEFVPGVYQAVYEFVPELETEMPLSVGEWVSVFERQCAGWVQAGRIVDGVLTEEVGLVPENYLHRLDFEEGGGELLDPEKESSTKADQLDGDGHDWKPTVDDNEADNGESTRRKEKEATPTQADQ